MSALNIDFGIADNGFTIGMQAAEKQTAAMERAVMSLIGNLERQHAEMTGNTAELTRYQASQLRMSQSQQEALRSLQASIAAEKEAIERKKQMAARQEALIAADAKRQASLNSLLNSIAAENAAIGKTSEELKLMQLRSLGASEEQLKRAKTQLQAVAADRQARAELSATAKGYQEAGQAVGGLEERLRMYVLALVSVGSVRQFGTDLDKYLAINGALRLVTNSQHELAFAMNSTYQIAQKVGTAWDGVASIYQKVARNGEKLGLTQQEVARITETISKAGAMSGGSAESLNAALVQLGQALDSGVLRGEEFNSMAEQAPVILQLLADSLGKTTGELRAMAAQGLLTSDLVTQAMLEQAEATDAAFAKLPRTIGQSLSEISNAFIQYLGHLNEAGELSQKFADASGWIAKNIDTVLVTALGTALAFVGKSAYSASAALVGKIQKLMQQRNASIAAAQATVSQTNAERLFIQAQLASAEAQLLRLNGMQRLAFVERVLVPLRAQNAAALAAETAATNAATAASSRLAAAKGLLLGAMGGPVGLVVTGLAVGAMWYAFSDDANTATAAIDAQSESIDALVQRYKAMNEAQKLQFEAEALKGLADAQKARDALADSGRVGSSPYTNVKTYRFGVETFYDPRKIQVVSDAVEQLKKGVISGQEALERFKQVELFDAEELANLTQATAEFENQSALVDRFSQHLDLLNGKEVTVRVKVDGAESLEMSVQESTIFTQLKAAADGFQKSHDEFGKTAEQLKLLKMETDLLKLSQSGASAAVMEVANAEYERAKAALAAVETLKAEDEMKRQAQQLEAKNAAFVEETIAARQRELETLGMSASQLLDFEMAAKGATDGQRLQAAAMDEVISSYQRQLAVQEQLEGLDKQIARLGKSDIEIKLMDLKDMGATDEQLAVAKERLNFMQTFKDAERESKAASKLGKDAADANRVQAAEFGRGVQSFNSGVDRLFGGTKKEEELPSVPQIQFFGPRENASLPSKAALQVPKMGDLPSLGTVNFNLDVNGKQFTQLLKTDAESAKAIMKLAEEANARNTASLAKRLKH